MCTFFNRAVSREKKTIHQQPARSKHSEKPLTPYNRYHTEPVHQTRDFCVPTRTSIIATLDPSFLLHFNGNTVNRWGDIGEYSRMVVVADKIRTYACFLLFVYCYNLGNEMLPILKMREGRWFDDDDEKNTCKVPRKSPLTLKLPVPDRCTKKLRGQFIRFSTFNLRTPVTEMLIASLFNGPKSFCILSVGVSRRRMYAHNRYAGIRTITKIRLSWFRSGQRLKMFCCFAQCVQYRI